ncbi:MAG: hypothetical protein ACK5B9_06185 [Flavobacteriia bacterium]|jgi:hypothetical protein
MLKKLLFCSTLILSFVGNSQNLDPTKNFEIDFTVPPKTKDYVDAKAIYIECFNAEDLSSKAYVEGYINPEKYSLVAEAALSDLYLKISNRSNVITPKQYSTSQEQKNVNGKPVSYTKYHYSSSHRFTVSIEIYSKSGVFIKSETHPLNFNVKASNDSKESADANYSQTYQNEYRNAVKNATALAFMRIESEYLFGIHKALLNPIKVKSRKFDYTDLNEAADLVTKWLEAKNYTLEDEGIKKAIGIYEEALKELNAEEKKVRVNSEIGGVCNYMLSCINFAVRDYSKANELILISEGLDKRIHYTQEQLKDALKNLQDRKAF